MGHTDARMTLGVYAQLLKLGPGNVEALEPVMGCTRDEARALFEAEDPRAQAAQFRTISEPAPRSASSLGRRRLAPRLKRPAFAGLSRERMKGLEPSTFCMASRRSSQLSYIRAERRV